MSLFSILLVISLTSLVILPVYAEVTSIQTNAGFYKGGSQIIFSGKIAQGDPQNVYIVIYDANNDYILLSSGSADNNTFQITVDTSTLDNKQKFSFKGIYNATAFDMNKASGKTIDFVFSPDGSSIIPSPPINLTATAYSPTEIFLNWSSPVMNGGSSITAYKIERNDGNGFIQIQNTLTLTYQDTGLISSKQYSYRISAVNSAGTSDPSSVAYATTLSTSVQTPSTSSGVSAQNNTGTAQTNDTQAIYDEIQKRIENAKRLQQLTQEQSKKISLNENMNFGDSAINLTSNMGATPENKSLPIDFDNVVYILITLAGSGVIATVLYAKKNKLWFNFDFKQKNRQNVSDSMKSIEKEHSYDEEDYSLMILKNRLAKGEITIEEFNRLRDALKEL